MSKKKNYPNDNVYQNYGSIAPILMKGGIGVLKTDTIYGLVGRAFSPKAVEKIYQVRKRESGKPFIILIGSIRDLDRFDVKLNSYQKKILKNIWPGKVSVILPCPKKKFLYLHRGKNSLAFRYPAKKDLVSLIRKVGSLTAPSANISGKDPARNISESLSYFSDKVDFYVDEGKAVSQASTLIDLAGEEPKILRKGSVSFGDIFKK